MRKLAGHPRHAFLLIALTVLVGLPLGGCGGDTTSGSPPESEPPPAGSAGASREATLLDIARVDELQARFNEDAGVPRLLLLLSPT